MVVSTWGITRRDPFFQEVTHQARQPRKHTGRTTASTLNTFRSAMAISISFT